MQSMEYATLAYRPGERAGWWLNDQAIVRDVVPVLDRLTQDGWKLTIVGAICLLERPQRQRLSPSRTMGMSPAARVLASATPVNSGLRGDAGAPG
jgi:hypothetical protein